MVLWGFCNGCVCCYFYSLLDSYKFSKVLFGIGVINMVIIFRYIWNIYIGK